ncbi:hypothetical protein DdX_13336 [Ditylenchus destructor]|uniref:C2H2-type domain-containing protein n=1 Tax=Ditylenchus destructor TaxID=166010 RepID=A0AAD4MU37_9BILA|nr:hypothetical protein DdX_13336 [Ditylenchus destructor]
MPLLHLICSRCRDNSSALFSSLDELEQHLARDHYDDCCFYECRLCTEHVPSFPTDCSLQFHKRKVHSGHQDEKDTRDTNLKLDIYNYLNSSTIGAAWAGIRCPLCLESDDSSSLFGSSLIKLEKHIAEIHYQKRSKIHECEACCGRFHTQYSMLIHVQTQHNDISNEQRKEIRAKIGIHESLDNSLKASFDAILSKPIRDRETKDETVDDRRTAMAESSTSATNADSSLAINRNSETVPLEAKSELIFQNVQPRIDIIEIDDDDEQTQVKQECGQTFRNAMKSEIEIIQIDDDDEQAEVKHECGQTPQDAALEVARSEIGQIHNAPASPEALPDTPHPLLPDTEPILLPTFNQQSDQNHEPMEEPEVAPNIDFGDLTSLNLYSDVISSDNGSESNTTYHFHGTSEEVQDSDVAHASMTAGQASDTGNTHLPHLNEVRTAVDPNASNGITATATSMPISKEIPPSKNAKGSNKQIGSRKSKPPIASQEPIQDEETPPKSRLRDRKKVHYAEFEDHGLRVETKRCRLSRIKQNPPQILEGNSLVTSTVDDPDQRFESETKEETSTRKTGSRDIRKVNRRKCNENRGQCSSVQMRTRGGYRRFKCKKCSYAATKRSHLIVHERTHTGERPYRVANKF